MPDTSIYDVIVIGSGNAGFSAAISAAQHLLSHRPSASHAQSRPKVLLLEKAPSEWIGGNTTFTAGAYRTVIPSLSAIQPYLHGIDEDLASKIDLPPYTSLDFLDDLNRVTNGQSNPALADVLVKQSAETTKWLAEEVGVPFILSFNRQAYQIDGRYKFWGGLYLSVQGQGKGLIDAYAKTAERLGVEVLFDSEVIDLFKDEETGRVEGVVIQRHVAPQGDIKPDDTSTTNEQTPSTNSTSLERYHAKCGIILASGGFEASRSMRTAHLGEAWSKAYVRGTPYNTGSLLNLSITKLNAAKDGHWSGCHATCWDANAPRDAGDQRLTNQFTKSGYPLGLMFNVHGKRFVDEGLDMRNYTYAKFGRAILGEDDGFAFQVWDDYSAGWLRLEEYAEDVVERISAGSLEELSEKLISKGLRDPARFLEEVREYNAAVGAFAKEFPETKFDPSRKDGLSTRCTRGGLQLDKTNWALPVVKPPFLAVKVTCGVTFTFGGLRVDPKTAGVISASTEEAIPGLYCAGEMLGGLFYENYPGGSGLTAGAVFGRIAGREAAKAAL